MYYLLDRIAVGSSSNCGDARSSAIAIGNQSARTHVVGVNRIRGGRTIDGLAASVGSGLLHVICDAGIEIGHLKKNITECNCPKGKAYTLSVISYLVDRISSVGGSHLGDARPASVAIGYRCTSAGSGGCRRACGISGGHAVDGLTARVNSSLSNVRRDAGIQIRNLFRTSKYSI